jgi:murein DD-endopeptidase MepM/ murein hydrolase activator NlpD
MIKKAILNMKLFLPSLFSGLLLYTIPSCAADNVVVRAGDTLSTIAARELGDSRRWSEICELNQEVLRDCDLISVGLNLAVPTKAATQSQVKEAEPLEAITPQAEEAQPVADAAVPAEVVERSNLIQSPNDVSSPYWDGYWQKPSAEIGYPDPNGGTAASRLAGTDAPASAGSSASGLIRNELTAPGDYTVSLWVRSTSGTIPFTFGISDQYQFPAEAIVGEEWQYLHANITVSEETPRLFQIVERMPSNPAWEIFGITVEKGTFSNPAP